jgi:hypothetical protein
MLELCIILHNLWLDLDNGVQPRWKRPEHVDLEPIHDRSDDNEDNLDNERQETRAGKEEENHHYNRL